VIASSHSFSLLFRCGSDRLASRVVLPVVVAFVHTEQVRQRSLDVDTAFVARVRDPGFAPLLSSPGEI